MLEEYIELLKPYVEELFKSDSSGHDISHLVRTMKLALYIGEREGADKLIVGIAAFLHDVHRIMQNESGVYVSPKDSLVRVREILSHVSLTNEQVEKICYAIEYHEKYNWNGDNVEDINTLVLQDADNLDAIGAIGIGRAFSYSGAHNSPMYRDDIPLENSDKYTENSGDDPSSIHHFYHKLFKLGENMNTKTAKEISEKRINFMKNFVNEFLSEWNVEL
jgi:uncharacterized protein